MIDRRGEDHLPTNDEVERRGRVPPSIEADLSASSTSLHGPSKLPARDRSNLELDGYADVHYRARLEGPQTDGLRST